MRFRLRSPPKPHQVENDIEDGCLKIARMRGYFVVRIHVGRFRTADLKRWIFGAKKGTPDYALLHARFPGFLLETKAPGASLNDDQLATIWEITTCFRLAVAVVDSIEVFADWLNIHESNWPERAA